MSPLLRNIPLLTHCALLGSLSAAAGSCAAQASESLPAAPGVSFGTMLQTFAGLALILGLFLGAAWLAKRLGVGNALTTGHGPMRVVGGLSLSPRERILLVEVGDTWLVVGVAPGQMRTLHTMPKGSIAEPGADERRFGQWLQHFKQKNTDAEH